VSGQELNLLPYGPDKAAGAAKAAPASFPEP